MVEFQFTSVKVNIMGVFVKKYYYSGWYNAWLREKA